MDGNSASKDSKRLQIKASDIYKITNIFNIYRMNTGYKVCNC